MSDQLFSVYYPSDWFDLICICIESLIICKYQGLSISDWNFFQLKHYNKLDSFKNGSPHAKFSHYIGGLKIFAIWYRKVSDLPRIAEKPPK